MIVRLNPPTLASDAVSEVFAPSAGLATLAGFSKTPWTYAAEDAPAAVPAEQTVAKRGLSDIWRYGAAAVLVSLGALTALMPRRRTEDEPPQRPRLDADNGSESV